MYFMTQLLAAAEHVHGAVRLERLGAAWSRLERLTGGLNRSKRHLALCV